MLTSAGSGSYPSAAGEMRAWEPRAPQPRSPNPMRILPRRFAKPTVSLEDIGILSLVLTENAGRQVVASIEAGSIHD